MIKSVPIFFVMDLFKLYIRKSCWVHYCLLRSRSNFVRTYCILAARRWVEYFIFRAFQKYYKAMDCRTVFWDNLEQEQIWNGFIGYHFELRNKNNTCLIISGCTLYRPDPTRSNIEMILWSSPKSSGRWLVRSDNLFENLEPLINVFGCSECNFELIGQNNTSCIISNSIPTAHIQPEVIYIWPLKNLVYKDRPSSRFYINSTDSLLH